MPRYKRLLIFAVLLLIALIYTINTIIDFSRLWNDSYLYHTLPNEMIKRINVLLAAVLIMLAGKDCISLQDNRLMKAVFVIIGAGELCFLLAKPVLAIAFFAVCQSLLIVRHSKGLSNKLKTASLSQNRRLFLATLALVALIYIGFEMLDSIARFPAPILIAKIYAIILSASLWMGLANYILGLFPNKNSKMVAIGMLCFFCCDILVGLDGLLPLGPAWILASSSIWVFYTPAITMLALSCYRYPEKSHSSAIIANT